MIRLLLFPVCFNSSPFNMTIIDSVFADGTPPVIEEQPPVPVTPLEPEIIWTKQIIIQPQDIAPVQPWIDQNGLWLLMMFVGIGIMLIAYNIPYRK